MFVFNKLTKLLLLFFILKTHNYFVLIVTTVHEIKINLASTHLSYQSAVNISTGIL